MKTRLLTFLIIFTLFLGIKNASAGSTYTWNSVSGTWTTASNWSGGPVGGYPGSGGSTTDIAIINQANITITYDGSSGNLTINSLKTNSYGIQGITIKFSNATPPSLTITSGLNLAQPTTTTPVITFGGTGTATIGGTSSFAYQSELSISSTATVTFSSGSIINYNNNNGALTNNGTLNCNGCTVNLTTNPTSLVNTGTVNATSSAVFNLAGSSPGSLINNTGTFNATSTTFNFTGSGSYIQNSGASASFTASSCTFNLSASGSPAVTINNTAVFRDHKSTYIVTGQGGNIQNTGASANMHLSGTTMTFGPTVNNGMSIINSNIFTADSLSNITLGTQNCAITNTGIFNAGVLNSPCSITLSGQASAITNNSTFNLGSTSIITASGYLPTVTNTSPGVFTLLSDIYGSATLGQTPELTGSAGGGKYIGTFNVQRYLTGGNTQYRSYRLLSSPVNLSSNTQGAGNISLTYINTNHIIVNGNAVAGTVTNYGALTAGLNGSTNGFTVANANPLLYFYQESLTTNNSTFVSGKFAGVTKVSASTVDVLLGTTPTTSQSIPVGNGFLFYFIGYNHSTITANTRVPEATTMTAVGTINQQAGNSSSSVTYTPVTLWWSGLTKLSYTSTIPNPGFNLVGNPFPSVIDLKKVYSDNASGASYTTFWELNDVNPNQGYVSYNGKDSTKSSPTLSSRYIASGQGFIVQATATPATQTLTFKEDQKVYSTSGILNSSSSPPILLSAPTRPGEIANRVITTALVKPNNIIQPSGISGLHLMLQKDSDAYRECGIYFNKKYSDNYDGDDAADLDGYGLNVLMSSFSADGMRTGINALSDYTKGKRIKLFVKATTSGVYHLSLEDISNIDTVLYNVYLVDKLHNDSLDIVRYKSYAFDLNAADTTTFGANRFVLAVERKPLPPYQLISFTGQKVTGGVQVNWKTYNEGNFTSFVLQKQGANKQFTALQSLQSSGATNYSYVDHSPLNGNNIYRLQQNDIDGNITYSAPVTITYNNSTATQSIFTIYPNPATELITVNLTSITKKSASYTSNIYNTAGEIVGHRIVSGDSWTEDVTAFKSGIYVIELKGNDGILIGKTKFVKTN